MLQCTTELHRRQLLLFGVLLLFNGIAAAPSTLTPVLEPNDQLVYTVDSFDKDATSGIQFLKCQQEVFWDQQRQTLSRLGLQDGMHVLDAGCGPGFLAEALLRWLPNLNITCIDAQPQFVAEARTRLSSFIAAGRLSVLSGNVGHLRSLLASDPPFDFSILRLILQHLPDPVSVLKQVVTLLRPGGRLLALDSDKAIADIQEPRNDRVDELYDQLQTMRRRQMPVVNDGRLGRILPGLLSSVGLVELEIGMHVASSYTQDMTLFLPLIDTDALYPLVRAGIVEAAELKTLQKEMEERFLNWKANGQSQPIVICFILAVSGVKPSMPP